MKMKTTLSFLLVAILAVSSFPQTALRVTEESLKEDMQMHVCKNGERLEAVKNLFRKRGAADDELKVEKFDNVENLVVSKKGRSDETIIVGAHFDKVSDGCGAIDNWTGIVIVANLFAALRTTPTDKTILFVAFGKEEQGLVGSHAMAKSIPKEQRTQFCSMINLDSFGLSYPQVLSNSSSPKMTKFAKELASEVKMPFAEASLAGSADADSSSFVAKEIPAITFHGLSSKWPEYLHSSKDKLANVNQQSVLVGYNFVALYLTRVDSKACSAFRK
jgi:Zn-dependent M28 family amino/carboxypeptidase